MDTVTLRSAEILAAFDGPLPGVYFGLSAEIQARIFTALAAFLAEHPSLPPLSTPSYGVRWPEVESQPGTRTWNHRGRRAQSRFAYLYGVDLAAPGERPVLTVPQVFALARQMPDRYRALILLATFASLRWGEAVALQRKDVDPDRGTVDVRQALIERTNGEVAIGPPKSRAGRRLVTVPAAVLPMIREHLAAFVPDGPDAFLFAGPLGGMLRRGYFRKRVGWPAAVAAVGCPGLHFHDLRHTGNTLASRTGASTKDLMARMGHDSARAALIYQHTNQQADRAIAEGLNASLASEAERPDDPDNGASGALVRVS